MKYLLSLLAFVTLTFATAQVGTVQKTMSKGTNTALTLELANADAKMVTKLWSDYLKDSYGAKTKYDRKEKEHQTLGVSAPALGSGRNVDMYSVIEDSRAGSMLFFWINTGDGYVDPTAYPNQFLEAQRVLTDFQLVVERAVIEDEVKAEEDKLQDLEKELKKLESDQEKLEREIEKAEEAIRRARADIEKNVKEQADQVEAIRQQQEVIDMTRRKLTQVGRGNN
jgi:hypothetical protein